jgi:hypothetical protein
MSTSVLQALNDHYGMVEVFFFYEKFIFSILVYSL